MISSSFGGPLAAEGWGELQVESLVSPVCFLLRADLQKRTLASTSRRTVEGSLRIRTQVNE